jgi:hypothetical protein
MYERNIRNKKRYKMFFWKKNKNKQEFVETRLGIFKKTPGKNNPNRLMYEGPIEWNDSSLDTEAIIFLDAKDPEALEKGLKTLEHILSKKNYGIKCLRNI